MTEEELLRIKKMLDSISDFPWEADLESGFIETHDGFGVCSIHPYASLHTVIRTGREFSHTDAEFIASAPTIIKSLLEEIDRLKNNQ